ncbi:MAG: DUF5615 family PIN-like protein [Bryobacterales bacterium]|nr:DUF5615 family PIN-like protein [Bryobacterales bacterium]
MSLRFLADADLNLQIVTGLIRREPSVDFLTAHAAGLRALGDLDVLRLAAQQERVLVSHDRKTMPRWLEHYLATGASSPGLILVPQSLGVGQAIDELAVVWAAARADEMRDRVMWLPL